MRLPQPMPCSAGGSGMQLDDIPVGHPVLASHVRAVESGRSPHARIFEHAGKVLEQEAVRLRMVAGACNTEAYPVLA